MVWAIGTRLILSKAQKSAGTNGPNHAGGMSVGSEMEVRSGALGVIGFVAVDVSCGLEVDSHEGGFLTLNESQYHGARTESLHRNLKK